MANVHSSGSGAGHNRRYTRYTGGPDPLAPPPDLARALGEIANDVMAGYSPEQALREYLRRAGIDELMERTFQARQSILDRYNLAGTLQEIQKLLDDAILAERGQLARDIEMDDTDRALREMQLDNLPTSPASAVNELSNYQWASHDARDTFKHIKDLLGHEMLEQRFAGMKSALENATDEDRAAINEMMRDLNILLAAHRLGEDTQEDFDNFMARWGHQFPEQPNNIGELIDLLAQRSAAAQRLLNSMTDDQRRELMELSAQAFGSPELFAQLTEMDSHLHTIRPDLDWNGGEQFRGDQGLGLGDGTGAIQNLGDLDNLADHLSQARPQDLDLAAIENLLGKDSSISARTLAELERAVRDSGLLRTDRDGALKLSPQAMRKLGASLLKDTTDSVNRGRRDSHAAGAAGEPTGASKPWEFGDTQPWDTTRTITNALLRGGADTAGGAEAAGGVRIDASDIEVIETESRTKQAVALLIDTSFSMAAEGRWIPMKRTALALHHLISTKFRGDELALISFGRYAKTMEIEQLTALPPVHEQGTNLHHGLMLAQQFFARNNTMRPTLLVVTDGEPTAHLEPWGEVWFNWPTHPATLSKTVTELDTVTRRGTHTTFFQLGHDPGLTQFLQQLADRVDGKLVIPELEELGSAVLSEYLRSRGQW
ncbi:vWA domain-containing protein [Corynebacterium cystitidis]|uniref:vWA domain-containing protein n=1 Tax=Corynebacterium cystitidis TaxID=35757 RepID=UPI00211F39DE|nr:VWA domain-containing protein [Corynebacterium cystitidis]